MKNLFNELKGMKFEEGSLSREEGWMLTYQYVNYYFNSSQFTRLRGGFQVEDLISEIYAKFLAKGFFEKYSSDVTSKKYYVMNSVYRSLIDISRKYREQFSLDKESEEGTDFYNVTPSEENVETDVVTSEITSAILESLSDETNSKVVGHSPLLGEVKMTERVIFHHLMNGYRVGEIAEMFINPKNNKPVSSSSISRIVKEAKENAKINFSYIASR